MEYAILVCTVFVFGVALILMEGEKFRVNNLLTLSSRAEASARVREIQYIERLGHIEGQINELIERDAKQFGAVTNSLVYDVEIAPSMETPYVEVMASIPRLHFRFDRRDLMHKDSLDMIATDCAQRLSKLSHDTVLRFLTDDMKIGRIIQ